MSLPKISLSQTQTMIDDIFQENMHKKRKMSLANATLGLLQSASSFIHSIGKGLAEVLNLQCKHAVKQVDRLLSNKKFNIWDCAAFWVPYVIGESSAIYVVLDWTSFAGDEQSTICLNLVTRQGCATPLVWHSVKNSQLKSNRARYEDQLLSRFKEVLPKNIHVTLLADRGVVSQKFFDFLENTLGFHYIIRLKSTIIVEDHEGRKDKSKNLVRANGRAQSFKDVYLTKERYPIAQLITVQDKGMKAPWLLVCSQASLKTREVIQLYSKRWKIEPYFREVKDHRFGFGLSATHISCPQRRDRLFFIVAMSYVLLTLLGTAGERIGFDRFLKVNTVKTRTHSLIRQGLFYYDFFHNFNPEQQEELLRTFNDILKQKTYWTTIFLIIQK